MIRLVVFFIAGVIFLGCAPKVQYTKSEAYAFIIKNKEATIADTGFIKYSPEQINLQIYKATEPIFELNLKDKVCINSICLTKEAFNRRFFSHRHYPDLMKDILTKKPIYNKKGYEKTDEGFRQRIKTEAFDLVYEVTKKRSYFKDRKNGVLFKQKSLK